MPRYLSTDPNAGEAVDAGRRPSSRVTGSASAAPRRRYLSTDPTAGESPEAAGYEQVAQAIAPMIPAGRAGLGVAKSLASGALGVAQTGARLGELMSPGESPPEYAAYHEQLDRAQAALAPKGAQEQAGALIEQVGEFAIPASKTGRAVAAIEKLPRGMNFLARQGVRGLEAAGVQATRTGEADETAVAAGIGGAAGGALGEGVVAVGRGLGSMAQGLVRSHIKPTVAAMKQVAGASAEGIEAKATQLVDFILTNRITTAARAGKIVQEAERELQRVLAVKNAPTDAAARADRYIAALKKSASKQGLPADDVAQLEQAAAALVKGPMGETVVTLVPGVGKGSIGGLRPVPTRVLRSEVPAQEALESARASSRWSTNKTWGEQKGTATEAVKAVERAQRDAVKAAVPEARPLLRRQSQGIQAQKALDRAEFRIANRDAAGLPAQISGAAEVSRGNVPVIGFALNILRDNQARMGVWADRLSAAIVKRDAPQVAWILHRLGVQVPPEAMRPVPVPAAAPPLARVASGKEER